MTADEYRVALSGLSGDQFLAFRESWGGAADTIEECVSRFSYSQMPEQWDRIAVYRLQQVGVTGVLTESEKLIQVSRMSARAARVSAAAAKKSATAAAQSAGWSRWTVILSVITVILSVITIAPACSVQHQQQQQQQRELVLRCDYGAGLQDVYALDVEAGSVRLMSVGPPRPGVLQVTESAYHLEFAENQPAEGYLLLVVDINRFTSKAERVIGRERTVIHQGERLNLHAERDAGDCVQIGVAF